MTRVLGPLLTDGPLVAEAAKICRRYTGVYSDEVARQQRLLGHPLKGVGESDRVKRVRGVIARQTVARFPEEQTPTIVLVCPGTAERVFRDGEGRYSATYDLQVHSYVVATDAIVGDELARVLALAAAKALLDGLPCRLGGRVGQVSWVRQMAPELPPLDDRSRHSAVHLLDVVLRDVLSDTGALPDLPPDDELTDPGDLPAVEDTAVTTTPVEEIDP